MPSIEERVIDLIASHLDIPREQITLRTSLVKDVALDSLDRVELIMRLEDEFHINISEDDAKKIDTVGGAIERIAQEVVES